MKFKTLLYIFFFLLLSCSQPKNQLEPKKEDIPNLDKIPGLSKKATNKYTFYEKDLVECNGTKPCHYLIKRKEGEFVHLLFENKGKSCNIELYYINPSGKTGENVSVNYMASYRFRGIDISNKRDDQYLCVVTIDKRISKFEFELRTLPE